MPGLFFLPKVAKRWPRLGWRDLFVFAALFAILYGLTYAAHGMSEPFVPSQPLPISLSPWMLPAYAWRSLVRMFLAFGLSLAFALTSGRIAARNPRAEKWIIPILDIMQSVPPLGFLAVAVTVFLRLFSHSLIGLELASVITIFSSQAWNLAFSFYQSLKSLPRDLNEAAIGFHLTPWQRFVKLELPFATTGLVWNSMMSFGSAWFFLAASETIMVLNSDYHLPGLGSYMAAALAREPVNVAAVIYAITAIIVLIVLVDQVFWRPVVAWSQRFRVTRLPDEPEATSALLNILRDANITGWGERHLLAPMDRALNRAFRTAQRQPRARATPARLARWVRYAAIAAILVWGLPLVARGTAVAMQALTVGTLFHLIYLGLLSLLRVAAVVVIASLLWVPVGVRIGFSPRLARIAQPLVQIGASFPSNVIFPLITYAFIRFHVSLNWGSVLLLLLSTQWYVLFNVIAGAEQVPSELREAAAAFHLRGWTLWRRLILPSIFPAWVTGALTAAGGAWNATIVAEVVTWGINPPAPAAGLGAYITEVTAKGLWPQTILSIAVMAAFVVLLNRWVWQPLYTVAEERFLA